ncbi:MAG: hypothetical protein GXP02_03890 [Alphaproteobacteria bacterium]|nr:hypothetical protein [Alphaproteobacteria bacterium]
MKKFIYSLRYTAIPLLTLILAACSFLTPETPASQTCKKIALGRLKHPGSYEGNSQTQTNPHKGQIKVTLTFSAWNDYKVPMPQNISCLFQGKKNGTVTGLLSVKWNGYPLRMIEMDNIRASLKKTGPQ